MEAMQIDTDKWLSECDAILAQLLGQPEKERPATHKIAARVVKSAPHFGMNEAVESASEGSSNQVESLALSSLFVAELKVTLKIV